MDRYNAASRRVTGQLVAGSVPDPGAPSATPGRGHRRAPPDVDASSTVPHVEDRPRQRLRGTTLVAAPMFLLGLIGSAAAVAIGLWGAWHPDDLGRQFAVAMIVSGAVAVAGFVAARGCFVELGSDDLRDVVGWVTVRRIPRSSIVEARVRAGGWRWFEVELDDTSLVTLVGASPSQFPSRLLPESRQRDLADLAAMRGD